MYTSLCAIRSWNWNWKLTQDNFLIEHWIQRTHRCSAVRCWPWGIYSSWLASRDLGTTRSSYLAWVGPVLHAIIQPDVSWDIESQHGLRSHFTDQLMALSKTAETSLLARQSYYSFALSRRSVLTVCTGPSKVAVSWAQSVQDGRVRSIVYPCGFI